MDKGLVEAVAQCLAKQSGLFIRASDWKTGKGDKYRDAAVNVLQTINNYKRGIKSGGLPYH